MSESTANTFTGENAIRDFLNPDKNPYVPLVELPASLNPFQKERIRIFAKLMHMLPLGNVKSLPAYNMLGEAEKERKLEKVSAFIERTSGNMAFSLTVIARFFGIKKTQAIISHELTWGKIQLLRFFGVHITVNKELASPDPNAKTSSVYQAREAGKRKGWFNPDQFANEANPRSHEKWTAPQIWEQTKGKITVFCAGLGTTGTLVGAGRYLKRKNKKIVTVGVIRPPDNLVPGVRTRNLLREISFDWQAAADHIEEIGTKESFAESLKLCRSGLMAGPSSGFALAGLINFLAKQKERGKLDDLKNNEDEIVSVFICPDGPLPYLNEYFEYLDASYFPPIENEEILIHKPPKFAS